ncbi:MAG: hypothetical protein JRJ29_22365 [Deltaproteobacteria bacterium]|nr:hypothetical protein [Deltaproteobacteria bacterium]
MMVALMTAVMVLALLLNTYALVFLIVLVASETSGHETTSDWILLLSLALVPVVNIIYILCCGRGTSWLSLYFKRKGLEEQKRIEAMSKD